MNWSKALLGVSLCLSIASASVSGILFLSTRATPATAQVPAAPSSSLEWVKVGLANRKHWELQEPLSLAAETWRRNEKEMLATLDVANEEQAGDVKVIMYRYSIGPKVFRKALWLRQAHGTWWITNEYFNRSAKDPFGDGQLDRARQLIDRVDKWERESADYRSFDI